MRKPTALFEEAPGRGGQASALQRKIALFSRPLDAASRKLWSSERLGAIYPELLISIHGVIRASIPLMEAAEREAAARSGSDPVSAQLESYLARHIPEERNHDEWLLEDLAVLGIERDEALRRIPPPEVASMVGAQYYWCRHHHPAAILGYLAVLEGNPPSERVLENALMRAGLPRAAFRTYFVHARLDPNHRDDLHAAIDGMPLDRAQRSLLGVSALHTLNCLQLLFEGAPRRAAAEDRVLVAPA